MALSGRRRRARTRRVPMALSIANPFSDEGLAALVAPPPPAGAPPPTTGGLTKLKELNLSSIQITDAGCDALAAALVCGALPALGSLFLFGTRASAAAKDTVREALLGRAPFLTARPPWRAGDNLPGAPSLWD